MQLINQRHIPKNTRITRVINIMVFQLKDKADRVPSIPKDTVMRAATRTVIRLDHRYLPKPISQSATLIHAVHLLLRQPMHLSEESVHLPATN